MGPKLVGGFCIPPFTMYSLVYCWVFAIFASMCASEHLCVLVNTPILG